MKRQRENIVTVLSRGTFGGRSLRERQVLEIADTIIEILNDPQCQSTAAYEYGNEIRCSHPAGHEGEHTP